MECCSLCTLRPSAVGKMEGSWWRHDAPCLSVVSWGVTGRLRGFLSVALPKNRYWDLWTCTLGPPLAVRFCGMLEKFPIWADRNRSIKCCLWNTHYQNSKTGELSSITCKEHKGYTKLTRDLGSTIDHRVRRILGLGPPLLSLHMSLPFFLHVTQWEKTY